jgi:hypothetical protein
MKRILLNMLLLILGTVTAMAQEKFNPEKIKAEVHSTITAEAKLTKEEAAAFFPLFDAMKEKQRALYRQQKEIGKQTPTTDAACRKAIERRDMLQKEMQTVEQSYHQKMMKVVAPAKVYNALEADRRCKRNAFKKAVRK